MSVALTCSTGIAASSQSAESAATASMERPSAEVMISG
jgi:hypothetical protein